MGAVVVTGASGMIGSRLVTALRGSWHVTAVSRAPVEGATRHVQGSFLSAEVLDACIDPLPDAVIHLAAVTGGCSEEDGLAVNVVGTLRLLRHFVDRGVKRFVLASSIAAPIGLAPDFVPLEVPIDDDSPTAAKDAYGMSKALMEQVACYFHRADPGLDITLFRIGVVLPEGAPPVAEGDLDRLSLPIIELSAIGVADVVAAFGLAAGRPASAGVHRMNLVAPWSRTPVPVVEALRRIFGDKAARLDLSYYETEANRFASLFRSDRVRAELGFVAAVDPRNPGVAV